MNQVLVNPINLKQPIFDHFIFPYRLNPNILTGERMTVEQFKEAASKTILPSDAEIIFMFHQLAVDPQDVDKKIADVRSLKIFLQLQCFIQAARHSLFENINISDNKSKANNYSPLNSPRAKTMRVQSQQSEVQQMMQFVKSNIKEILRCVTMEDTITANEFAVLNIFLKNETKGLFERGNRVSVVAAIEWILTNLRCVETYLISGFTKSVTIKTQVPPDVKIQQCDDSLIFIDAAIQTLCITQCNNCQIYVSAVSQITSITSCEKVQICVASNIIKISNTIDSVIHYFGSHAPIIYGDSRNITLAPHSGNTLKILDRLREARILISKQNRDRYIKPSIMGLNKIDWSIQPLEDFSRFIIPDDPFGSIDSQLILDCNLDIDRMAREITDKKILTQPMNQERIILPLLSPPEYIRSVFERYKAYNSVMGQIRNANLKDDFARQLQSAIQGNFREWLVTAGAIKQLTDLVKLIDQE